MPNNRHLSADNSSEFFSNKRAALVIGNSNYEQHPLITPVNDSADMANLLERLNFDVQLLQDVNRREMIEAVDEFGMNIARGGVGLFYYAGHGIQEKGLNYLIPIDARIDKEVHLLSDGIDVSLVLTAMDVAQSRVNIVILDACRDNPFKKYRGSRGGLAPIAGASVKGTLFAYSTAPNSVAEDGNSRNSPYTEELIKFIPQAGCRIGDILIQVCSSVFEKTNGRQTPWESSSLTGPFYFIPPSADKTLSHLPLIEEARVIYRNRSERLTETQAKAIIEKHGFFELNWNKLVMGIKHEYLLMQEGKIVYDKTANLIWQQSGSDNRVSHNDADVFIAKLNQEINGNHSDWRLPTLEEAMSLMEKHRNNDGLHIHPIFDKKQRFIWTSDDASADMVWTVHFSDGLCIRNQVDSNYFVRAVRNGY